MEKVYKLTLIPILGLFILLATFLVGCSNKQPVADNPPTYPQTFETDTSRNIAQELVKYLRGNDQLQITSVLIFIQISLILTKHLLQVILNSVTFKQ